MTSLPRSLSYCACLGGHIRPSCDSLQAPMGFLNPFIYAHAELFTDVTKGNNPGCSTNGFYAAAGW